MNSEKIIEVSNIEQKEYEGTPYKILTTGDGEMRLYSKNKKGDVGAFGIVNQNGKYRVKTWFGKNSKFPMVTDAELIAVSNTNEQKKEEVKDVGPQHERLEAKKQKSIEWQNSLKCAIDFCKILSEKAPEGFKGMTSDFVLITAHKFFSFSQSVLNGEAIDTNTTEGKAEGTSSEEQPDIPF